MEAELRSVTIAATVPLLWRNEPPRPGAEPETPVPTTRGPRQRSSADAVVTAGIELADTGGLESVTMRAVVGTLSAERRS